MTSAYVGQRVLVTGASGFIGGALCRRLTGLGAEVYAVSRSTPGSGAPASRWLHADLVLTEEADQVVETARPEVVFHLASHVAGARDVALVPVTLRDNLMSAVNVMTSLVEAGVGCRCVVLAGSMEEPLGGSETPRSPYAASKWASTGYGRMFSALYDLPVVTARIFMTYGPAQRDRTKLVPYVIESLLRGEAPVLTSGDRLVDWIYVEDVVDGLLALGLAPEVAGRTVDIGSGELTSIRTVVEHLVRIVDPRIEPRFGALPVRALEHSRIADIARTRQHVGWEPRTPLEDGLARTVEWYREHQQVR